MNTFIKLHKSHNITFLNQNNFDKNYFYFFIIKDCLKFNTKKNKII